MSKDIEQARTGLRNLFSIMAGATAGMDAVAVHTLGNAVSNADWLATYMTLGMPAYFLTAGAAVCGIASIGMIEKPWRPGKFVEPKRLVASFLIAAAGYAGVAEMAGLPLVAPPPNETRIEMQGDCNHARVQNGAVVLPQGCTLGQ